MFKQFLLKKAMQYKMKDLPEAQQQMVTTLIENHPELFQKIAKEVEHKVKKEGRNEMLAMMEVSKKYQKELREALGQ